MSKKSDQNPERPNQSISGFNIGGKLIGRDDNSGDITSRSHNTKTQILIQISVLILLVVGGGYLAFRWAKDGFSFWKNDTPAQQNQVTPNPSP
jgi:hypothetical protein